MEAIQLNPLSRITRKSKRKLQSIMETLKKPFSDTSSLDSENLAADMSHPPLHAHRKWLPLRRRPWWIALGVTLASILIVAVVTPLATLLPHRTNGGESEKAGVPATLLFPLYIYPESNSTWGWLYDAIEKNPTLPFLVVINPNSGPGDSSTPNEQYQAAISILSSYPNVQKVGYVRTGYGSRDINDVLSEIDVYAGWNAQNSEWGTQGVFFDEAPYEYSQEIVDYMTSANQRVKSVGGIGGARTVIHNPGVIPSSQLSIPNTDITVVFEQSYSEYINGLKDELEALDRDRTQTSYIFHSVPSMDDGALKSFVDGISQKAKYLFVTSLTESYYNFFGPEFGRFANSVPR